MKKNEPSQRPVRFRQLPVLLFSLIFMVTAGPPALAADVTSERPLPETALAEARKIAQSLADQVRGHLVEALRQGGFAGAVRVCSEVAQELAKEASTRSGASVRRISLNYRNPKNSPDGIEAGKLAFIDAERAGNRLKEDYAEVVATDGREVLHFLKPLVTQRLCLNCHGQGDEVDPGVRAILHQIYPGDLATGYREGDVRGAIALRIPVLPR